MEETVLEGFPYMKGDFIRLWNTDTFYTVATLEKYNEQDSSSISLYRDGKELPVTRLGMKHVFLHNLKFRDSRLNPEIVSAGEVRENLETQRDVLNYRFGVVEDIIDTRNNESFMRTSAFEDALYSVD